VSRANEARARRRAFHQANLRAARTPSRRLAAAWDWLRAEARRAGPDVIEETTEQVLAMAEQLHQAETGPATTNPGR
jgi:hypothetical protein